ncbi:MAG: phage tail tip lysozyme [Candidatus Saccharibacteria bacterium]|nr:phage tail tip lysozyme [Candidatus Saccharibacteria bacterium]
MYEKNDISFYDENFVACSPSSTNGVSGSDNPEKIWGFLKANGLSDEQVAGIMGNMKAESGFSPTRQEVGHTFPAGGWGLAQWTGVRRDAIAKALQEKHPDLVQYYNDTYGRAAGPSGVPEGLPIDANDKLLIFELQFMIEESKKRPITEDRYGTASSEWELLKTLTTVEDAAVFWHNNFEVSNDSPEAVIDNRGGGAKEAYERFKGTGGSGATSSPSTPKVTFIGDSITDGMRANLTSSFPGSNVEAKVGEGIQWVISKLDTTTLNDTVVVNIGTNDNFPVDKAKEMLNKLKSKKVYLVNNFGKGGNANFEIINGGIASVASEYTNVTIIDWKKIAESNGGREALYKPDGYHINDDKGRELYIKLLKDSLGSATTSAGGACESTAPTGDVQAYALKYAWPKWRGLDTTKKPEYAAANDAAVKEGRFIGGGEYPGIDCGGFVTTIVHDSGFDKGYNYNAKISDGASDTTAQERWVSENWQKLGDGGSINVADLKPGDVAFSPGHTFIFVGTIDGFESDIASASLDERAPVAGNESKVAPNVTWYRKK